MICSIHNQYPSHSSSAASFKLNPRIIPFEELNTLKRLNNMSNNAFMLLFITMLLLSAMHSAKAHAPSKTPVIELYMHDILGGSNPTARPITGLLGNIYNGQVPFARPLGLVAPKNGVAIPNSGGSNPTLNRNGVPLGTGLAGTTFSGKNNQNTNTAQLLPDGLGLGFGTITVIDDILTTSPDLGSQTVGKAQGVYVASSTEGSTQMMAFTAMLEGGEYGDSINFYGIYKIGSTTSKLSITGGTGKFKNACGFAELRSLIPSGQQVTNGAESLLRILVHLQC